MSSLTFKSQNQNKLGLGCAKLCPPKACYTLASVYLAYIEVAYYTNKRGIFQTWQNPPSLTGGQQPVQLQGVILVLFYHTSES